MFEPHAKNSRNDTHQFAGILFAVSRSTLLTQQSELLYLVLTQSAWDIRTCRLLDSSIWIRTGKCCAIGTRVHQAWVGLDWKHYGRCLCGRAEVESIWEAGTSTRIQARLSRGHQSHAPGPAATTQTRAILEFLGERVRAALLRQTDRFSLSGTTASQRLCLPQPSAVVRLRPHSLLPKRALPSPRPRNS